MSQKPSLDPQDVIQGGCRDGFWVRRNCDMAASMGLCSYSRIEDDRPDPDLIGMQSWDAADRAAEVETDSTP